MNCYDRETERLRSIARDAANEFGYDYAIVLWNDSIRKRTVVELEIAREGFTILEVIKA